MPAAVHTLPVLTFDTLEDALAYTRRQSYQTTASSQRGRSPVTMKRSNSFDDSKTASTTGSGSPTKLMARSRSVGGGGGARRGYNGANSRSCSPCSRRMSGGANSSRRPSISGGSVCSAVSAASSKASRRSTASAASGGSSRRGGFVRSSSNHSLGSGRSASPAPRRRRRNSQESGSGVGTTTTTTKRSIYDDTFGDDVSLGSGRKRGGKKKNSNKTTKRCSSNMSDTSRLSMSSVADAQSVTSSATNSRKKKRASSMRVDSTGATTEFLSSAPPPGQEEVEVVSPSCSSSVGGGGRRSKRPTFNGEEEEETYSDSYDVESNRYNETYIRQADTVKRNSASSSSPCCCSYWRLCHIGVCFLLLGGATLFLLFFFKVLETPDAFEDNFVKEWIDSDPWADISPDKNYVWEASSLSETEDGRIVGLEIWNAMGRPWQDAFHVAVANWQDANQTITSSNILDLTVRDVTADLECEPVPGVIKICSGNYGPTGWRGKNQLILDDSKDGEDRIIASAARINEFYFEEEEEDASGDSDDYYVRLYTICHELGHAFGLPHWDENSFNMNNGNCMDYTENNFKQNSRPDVTNFLFLEGLYEP